MANLIPEITVYESIRRSRNRMWQIQQEIREMVLAGREAVSASRVALAEIDRVFSSDGLVAHRDRRAGNLPDRRADSC